MATYAKLTKGQLNADLETYNSTALRQEAKLLLTVDNMLFPAGTTRIPYVNDTMGTSNVFLASTLNFLFENQAAGSGHSIMVSSGGGQNVVLLGAQNATLTDFGGYGFGDKGDVLVGGPGQDVIQASSTGDDTLYAGANHTTLRGGGGVDKLVGGGQSSVVAGAGDDTLFGGLRFSARNSLYGGIGNDLLSVKAGNNLLSAGLGLNTLWGGAGSDTLYGGGQSALHAGQGSQKLFGGLTASASDTLYGATSGPAGPETLTTFQGDNSIVAGIGMETIHTGNGSDTVTATTGGHHTINAGGDLLVDFGGTHGLDTVRGFSNAVTIDVINEQKAGKQHHGASTILFFKDGQTLTYSGSDVTVTFT